VARLIQNLNAQGATSIILSRQQGLALLCGFEQEADASKFAEEVQAMPMNRYGGWKSQRGFLLNGGKYAAILKIMAAPPRKQFGERVTQPRPL